VQSVLVAEVETVIDVADDLDGKIALARSEIAGFIRSGVAGRGAFLMLSATGRRIAAEIESTPPPRRCGGGARRRTLAAEPTP
jgi:hypothetical protein